MHPTLFRRCVAALWVLYLSDSFVVDGFTAPLQSSSSSRPTRATTTKRFMEDQEKALRQEIADRNSIVPNEAQFAVADGEFLERLATVDPAAPADEGARADGGEQRVKASPVAAAAATAAKPTPEPASVPTNTSPAITVERMSSSELEARIERLTKPRAYPLFLAEKAVEFVEAAVDDMGKLFAEADADDKPGEYTNGDGPVKERVVVLGTGWGAAAFLKSIDTEQFDVTVISPRNYFLFTPMLAGASVGTVEYRSITEPVREINRKAKYLEATATEVDLDSRTVTCQSVVCDGSACEIHEFRVPYDRVVVTVGAQTNTFGIPGVREHCFFLKQVEDARRIRTAIVNSFERANLPDLSDEERERCLTFAVIGAGPTGIEFAAELRDFIEQDGPKYYPNLLKYVRIKVIEASSTVLAPFDKSLQDEAIEQLSRTVAVEDPEVVALLPERFRLTELLLDSSVKEITGTTILLNDGKEIPYGISVWAAGNGPIPLTLQVIEALGEEQGKEQSTARGRVAVDPWMRAVGGRGRILAFGDCSCITKAQLPATAQVAAQQGEYLANMMNKRFNLSPAASTGGTVYPPPTRDPDRTELSWSDGIANFATNGDGEFAKPFQFLNLGILAYTGGGSALAQVETAPNAPPIKGTGAVGNAVWRSVYLSKQVSWRNRLLVLNDWTRRTLFGRDITRV